MDKGFVLLIVLLSGCTSYSPEPETREEVVQEHHIWTTGDSWTYLAIPPGHPTNTAGIWTYEITGMETIEGHEVAVLEKRYE